MTVAEENYQVLFWALLIITSCSFCYLDVSERVISFTQKLLVYYFEFVLRGLGVTVRVETKCYSLLLHCPTMLQPASLPQPRGPCARWTVQQWQQGNSSNNCRSSAASVSHWQGCLPVPECGPATARWTSPWPGCRSRAATQRQQFLEIMSTYKLFDSCPLTSTKIWTVRTQEQGKACIRSQ